MFVLFTLYAEAHHIYTIPLSCLVLRRWVAVLLRRTVTVLLGLTLMTAETAAGNLRLETAVLSGLPLADVAEVDVFAAQRDQRDPAELEPSLGFRLDDLGVLTSWADAGGSIAFLFDLGGTAEDDWDEEAEVLRSWENG